MDQSQASPMAAEADDYAQGRTLAETWQVLRENLGLLVAAPLAAGVVALGVAFLIPPTFTAKVTFMPPQQAQSTAAAALASLGQLASLAGAGAGRNLGELYASLVQSVTISDRLIDQFDLVTVYDEDYRTDARKRLTKNTRVTLGRRDGLISVEVDDRSPQRAAEIANRYVEELRRLTASLAVGEAQQRRAFFEQQLQMTHARLIAAQTALQSSGFNAGALRAEPRAAAESFARLKAEITAAEVRLQALRDRLTENAPEVRQQLATLTALRQQLARVEQPPSETGGPDYVSRYREFKYQEALFEVYARQFEVARVDESREGAQIQVVDAATPPERKSRPPRALIAVAATIVTALLLAGWVLLRTDRRP